MQPVKYSELQALECEALSAIRQEGVFRRLPSLSIAAHQAQIIQQPKQAVDIHLAFTLPIRLREDPGASAVERDVQVGCFAVGSPQNEISQLTYSVLIGRDPHPSRSIARKLHFDFEPAKHRNNDEPKPTYHMQLCGLLSPQHLSQGYEETHVGHLLPSWSKPRVPTQPMSLALVLNWLFMEFGSEAQLYDIRQNMRWRKVVRQAERRVLLPYYQSCSEFLSSHSHDEESFFQNKLYEVS